MPASPVIYFHLPLKIAILKHLRTLLKLQKKKEEDAH